MRIGISSNAPSFLFLYVAQDTGIFAAHGLDATITQITPTAAVAALVSGELDFVVNIPSVMQGAESGLPLRVVLVSSAHSGEVLMGAKGIQSVSDLRGQVVAGSTPGSEPNELTAELLEAHGVEPGSYQVLSGGNSDAAREALVDNNDAQAAVVGLDAAIPMLDEGDPLLDDATELKTLGGGLGTSEATIQQRHDVVQRTVSAALEALQVCATQDDTVKSVLSSRYGFNADDAQKAFSLLANRWQVDGRPDEATIQAQIQMDVQGQQLAQAPAESAIFDLSFLPPATGQ